MMHNVLRWTLAILALVVVGPLLTLVTGLAPSPGGSGVASPVFSGSLVTGMLAWMLGFVIAGAYALLVTRLTTWRLGVTCLGLCLVWSAWSTPTLSDVVRVDDAGLVTTMLIDNVLLTLLAAGVAFFCVKRAEGSGGDAHDPDTTTIGAASGAAILACAAGALVACFLIAQDERVGQALGAAVVAGFAGGALGRAFAPKAPAWIALAGFPLAALAAPLIGGVLTKAPIVDAVYDGSVSSLLRVMPAYWAVGVLIGFPAGSAQGDSIAQKQGDGVSSPGKPAPRTATT